MVGMVSKMQRSTAGAAGALILGAVILATGCMSGAYTTERDKTTRGAAIGAATGAVLAAVVGGGVNQPGLLGLVQDAEGFIFGDGAGSLAMGKSVLNRGEEQTILSRMVAALTDKLLLNAANAVTHPPGFGSFEQFRGPLVGKNLYVKRN